MPDRLTASTSPHIHSHELTAQAMWAVFLALVPAGVAGVYIFGLSALKIIVISILSCIIFEALIQRLTGREVTVLDGSAAITGILLAYNLSSNVPLWIPVVGSFFAIAIVKLAFAGLGRNIFNPALAARAFLLSSWPKYMTDFDALTGATPLVMIKEGKAQDLAEIGLTYRDLFLGNRGGCIGEVCILALLLGAVYLLWKKHIWWQTPFAFVVTLGGLSWIFAVQGFFKGDFLFSILSGGIILGAFFMATDYVTSPLSRKGQLVFGIGCGLIAFLIRRFGGYPEGVSYAILIMNAFVPLIDRHIRPRVYGT
ncbi:MAG: RnfABCDGE type electron transport complex subunit D [Candidatus Omnitrophota bacterium]